MNIKDIVNEVRRIFRIKDKTIDDGNNVAEIKQESPKCSHQPRYREYYREGCYKCWECGKIFIN